MPKHSVSQTDIIIILIATLFAITVNLPFLTLDLTVRNIFSVLFLFIPGYTVLISIFPTANLGLIKKVLYSFLISMGLLFLILVLKNTFFNSLVITEPNLNILLALITIIFVIFAYIRRKRSLNTVQTKRWIACRKCGEFYELHEGESLEDFESCMCGGELYNVPYNFESVGSKKDPETHEKAKKRKISDYLAVDVALVIFITFLSIASVSIPLFNESILRTILVSILIFFLSGYALIAAVFPLKELNKIMRLVLSIVLSTVIIFSLGLIFSLNQSAVSSIVGILIISIVTISLILISVIRRLRFSKDEISLEKIEFKEDFNEKKIEEKQIPRSQYLPADLILIFLATVSCLIFEFTVPDKSFIEIIFGLLFILFLPGYSLIAAVFPKQNDLEKIERVALSFGLSVLIAPIIGLLLNYTSYGINLTPLIVALSAFTIFMEIPAYIRRRRVPEGDRFIVKFRHYSNEMTEDDGVKDR